MTSQESSSTGFAARAGIGFAIVCAAYLALTLPLLSVASDDIRMVDVFSTDESLAASAVSYLLRSDSLELLHYSYGGLFFYLPLAFLKLLSLGAPVTEQVVIVGMRAIQCAAGVGCLYVVWRLAADRVGPVVGLAAPLLLAFNPAFLRWSVEIHPDIPQLAWIAASLWAVSRMVDGPALRDCLIASVCAGLAMGTKYSGVFLLPLIILAVWIPSGGDVRSRLVMTAAAVAALLAAFFLTNPYVPFRFDTFRADVAFEGVHLAEGHDVTVARAGLAWWGVLARLAGVGATAAAVIGIIGLARQGVDRFRSVEGLLIAWILGYVGFLTLEANLVADRHLLPVLPAVLVLSASGCAALLDVLGKERRRLAGAGVAALLAVSVAPLAAAAVERFDHRRTLVEDRPEIEAGRWMAGAYGPSTTIVHDAYAYVPSVFPDAYRSYGMTAPVIYHFDPDLLVVRDAVAARFASAADTTRTRLSAGAFLDRHVFYRLAKEDLLPRYKRRKTFEGVIILERAEPPLDRPAWPQRVRLLQSNRLVNADRARERIGDLLGASGNWTSAVREYRMGLTARPENARLYLKLGRALLAAGQPGEAGRVYEMLLTAMGDRPASERAGVLQHIARRMFSAGRHQQAFEALEEALDHAPGDASLSLDRAAFHLALGAPAGSVERSAVVARLEDLRNRSVLTAEQADRARKAVGRGGE